MPKILVADDEEDLRETIVDCLLAEDYIVEEAADGKQTLDLLAVSDYDVIILDWKMPHASGPEICQKYRRSGGKAAIIMLTGNKEVDEKVMGLESGADDYLTKPVHVKELISRVKAAMRRSSDYSNLLKSGGLLLDLSRKSMSLHGKEIDLLPKEFALLEFLMRHPNVTFSSEALLARVWPTDAETSPDTIRKYVSRLREKIDVSGEESPIRTIHGLGYRFEPQT